MATYTASGFSKPFGCCSHWQQCDLGKIENRCHYRETDPETMQSCMAFQRNRKEESDMVELEKALNLFDLLYN